MIVVRGMLFGVVLVGGGLSGLATASPVGSDDDFALERPVKRGALKHAGRDCDRTSSRFIALDAVECTYGFYVAPRRSGDPDHNYLIDWHQVSAKAREGACLVGATGGIVTEGAEVLAVAPGERLEKGRVTSRLPVRSEDGAWLGSIRRTYRIRDGVLKTREVSTGRAGGIRWSWKGKTRRHVRFAVGVLVRIPTGDGLLFQDSFGDVTTTRGCARGRAPKITVSRSDERTVMAEPRGILPG